MKSRIYSFLCLLLFLGSCKDQENVIDYLQIADGSFLAIEELHGNLDVPWEMQYLPSEHAIYFTQIKGKISKLDLVTNKMEEIYQVPNVYHQSTLGLLGLAIHPDFDKNPFLYICYTTKEGEDLFSELSRLEIHEGKVVSSKLLLKIDGGSGHNGSRLLFDQKGYLFWATGDVHSETHAQDSTTLNGKVLRMTADGLIPADNPIKDSYVYAWGFRNIQGMTETSQGRIFTSEHGDAIEDEVNWIRPLHNYGWIEIEGFHDTAEEKEIAAKSPRTEPVRSWTPVIAPSALVYYGNHLIPSWNNSLLLGTLKSQSLRILKLDSEQKEINQEEIYLKDHYGRIRAICVDTAGNIYLATSNRDWNPQSGFPKKTDDRILKIYPTKDIPKTFLSQFKETKEAVIEGKTLYNTYCASCHKEDGKGIEGNFPPLHQTEAVRNSERFLQSVFKGVNGKIEVNSVIYEGQMPAFNFLKDEEIQAITNYIRSNFGNQYSEIGLEEIKVARERHTK